MRVCCCTWVTPLRGIKVFVLQLWCCRQSLDVLSAEEKGQRRFEGDKQVSVLWFQVQRRDVFAEKKTRTRKKLEHKLFPGRRHLPPKSQLQFLEKTAEQVRKMHGRASVWCGEAGSAGCRQDQPSLEKKKKTNKTDWITDTVPGQTQSPQSVSQFVWRSVFFQWS